MSKIIVVVLMLVGGTLFFMNSQKNTPTEKSSAQTTGERPDISRAPRAGVDPFDGLSGAVRKPGEAIEQLTFSNTMQLGEDFRVFLDDPAPTLRTNEKLIQVPEFPANSSLRTAEELKLLHEYVSLRTPERVAQIREEASNFRMKVGPESVATYLQDSRYVLTGKAIGQVLTEINPVIMRSKTRYDRVRPHKLDPTLTTVIDVPEHPAYPSGHSTQAHAVAFLLTTLVPDRRAEFESDALRIAVNREIAGVHYPSDTAAGRLMARQLLDLMLRDQEFAALVESAKAEW